jgi:hypothetical protein
MRKLMAITGTVAMITALASAPVAAASPHVESFEDAGGGVNPFLTDACGVPIHDAWTERGTFIEYADGSIFVQSTVTNTLSGPGGSVETRSATTVHGTPILVVVDEVAGTVTESYTDRLAGLVNQWRVTGSPPMRQVAGNVAVDVTLVYDLETDELLSVTEVITNNGGTYTTPDESTFAMLCDAVT